MWVEVDGGKENLNEFVGTGTMKLGGPCTFCPLLQSSVAKCYFFFTLHGISKHRNVVTLLFIHSDV